jgi:hypothetical protein
MKVCAGSMFLLTLTMAQLLSAQQSAKVSAVFKGDDSEIIPLTLEKERPEDTPNGPIGTTKWFITKNLPSGMGKNFSKWYFITSPPPPKGYVVFKMTFETRGDRHCHGGDSANYQKGQAPQLWQVQEESKMLAQDYAECELVERTPQSVTWRFRFKGHQDIDNGIQVDSNKGAGVSYGRKNYGGISDALLSVTYVPAPK